MKTKDKALLLDFTALSAQTTFLPLAAIAIWFVSPQVSDRLIRKAIGVE